MKLEYTGKFRLAMPRFPVEIVDPENPPEPEDFVIFTRENRIQDYPHWEKVKNKRAIKKLVENGQLRVLDNRRLPSPTEPEPEPEMTLSDFRNLNYKLAAKWVARSNDLGTLKSYLEGEARQSVKSNLENRISALQD